LIIVPDGVLHQVPFDALVVTPSAGYRDARYVLDDYEVMYASSARWRPASAGRDGPPRRVLAVEAFAPGGREEMAAIRAAFPADRVRTLTGAQATETAVRAAWHDSDVLHVAAHAQANDADVLASHLRLAADSLSDGYVHLSEIGDAPPRGLVVLSACATLEGRLYPGEGLAGLARAFLVGGARGVVATRWPIGASTAAVTRTFYREVASGATPAAALRRARLAVRRDARTAHPFFWGGFVFVAGG
jgi:CHAT domain-containing protein